MGLDRLEAATQNLGRRVLSLSRLIKKSSNSSDDNLTPGPVSHPEKSLVNLVVDTMARTCHGCHAPIDEDHQDHPSGWQKCRLEHWDGCQGGIAEGKAPNGSDWRGCPLGYVFVESVEDGSGSDDLEDGLDKNELTIGGDDDKEVGAAATKCDNNSESNTDLVIEKPHDANPQETVTEVVEDPDLFLQQLEAANLLLRKQAEVRDQQASVERDRRVAMLKAENARLAKSMNGDIGGAKVKDAQTHSQFQPHPKNSQRKTLIGNGKSSLPSHQVHFTRNRLLASEYRPEDTSMYSGLDIKGIRKIPDIQEQVDRLIGAVQHLAPSLDSRPSFVLDKTAPPKPAVPMVFSAKNFSAAATPATGDDPETSGDEEFDEAPRKGFVFRWRRDANGEKYNVEEKITVGQEEDADLVYRYVRDEATGRSYKKLVLRDNPEEELVPQWVVNPATGKKVRMLVPSQQNVRKEEATGSFTDCLDNFTTPLPPSRVKTPQLSSSAPARTRASTATLQDEKQGKMPNIVSYARDCPVSWTSKITSDKLNMGLWCWAFISELLATRTGQAPTLQHGELEARLKHFLNVLEIALQPSSSSEFDTHAWRVARLYAEKVQQKVERGDTWLGFETRYGSDSQPHELMAAERELAARIPKKKEKEKEEARGSQEKRTCTTWNTSSVEGKCDYEVQNDGRSCSRRHECTWCKEKGKRSLHHQRSFCRQRIAAGDQ